MSATVMVLAVMLPAATAQSLQLSPSLGTGGGITFPLYSSGHKKDIFMGESTASSDRVVNVVPAPNQINDSPSYSVYGDSFKFSSAFPESNTSNADYAKFDNFLGGEFSQGTSSRMPNYAPALSDSRNHTSRFFTLNTSRQTLDLGLSFTVPFLSFPMSSLASMGQNFGENTFSALNSLMAINWPSVILIGAAILGAALLLPQLGTLLTSLMSGTGDTSTYTSSYGRNIDRGDSGLPVTPFTAIIEQLDDALAQYDLDSTSCMQRAVCSYIADSEDSVKEGQPDSSEMIAVGLARSHWMQNLLGQGSIAKAVELGRSGGHCQWQFPNCPFSLGGVLRFLAAYAKMTS